MTSFLQLAPGEGPTLTALGSTYVTKTDGTHVAGAFSMYEEEFWADTTPLHRHSGAEESFYLLSGELEAWVEEDTARATAGAFLVIPRGAAHGLRRVSVEPVRMLTLIAPPGFEALFGAVVQQGEEELLREPQRLAALAASHRTEILGDYPG